MPTRKQRRRQAKSKRHEYEYVYVDEEGNEVEVAEDDVKAERTASRNGRAKPNPRTALMICGKRAISASNPLFNFAPVSRAFRAS